ncbi:hypothetical protein L210DRAFT_858142 [Boletus edulis BED1]|uniref:Uncharacterized protein n=1 Tax=Boletus edulis BED1 TaxID=1328754 RepID=A0AAD4BTU0_BOLED|nr:hypothetical protein L210DRAFT_858142 [Boletus edulis BED1]
MLSYCDFAGERQAHKAMAAAIDFIQRSISSAVSANMFILIDTHSETLTGGLQCTAGSKPTYSLTTKLLKDFCSDDFLNTMKTAACTASL